MNIEQAVKSKFDNANATNIFVNRVVYP